MSPAAQRLAVAAFSTLWLALLASCASQPKPPAKTSPAEPVDGPSAIGLKAADVKDAVPRSEPRARYGNHSPYEVFGKKYYVLNTSTGYRQRGTASWYGTKFHGRRTSSGEPYDMHLATAAHKTLPLPSYAEVTNLANGKKIIVKINDRGPFKDDRLIDLSYGAALRLGVVATGTAPVDVRVIDVNSDVRVAAAPVSATPTATAAMSATWLQAGAYQQKEGAENLADQLSRANLKPVSIHDADKLFRVWLGPFDSAPEAEAVIQRAIELGFERPHKVSR